MTVHEESSIKLTKNASTLHIPKKNQVFSALALSCAQGGKSRYSLKTYHSGVYSTFDTLFPLRIMNSWHYIYLTWVWEGNVAEDNVHTCMCLKKSKHQVHVYDLWLYSQEGCPAFSGGVPPPPHINPDCTTKHSVRDSVYHFDSIPWIFDPCRCLSFSTHSGSVCSCCSSQLPTESVCLGSSTCWLVSCFFSEASKCSETGSVQGIYGIFIDPFKISKN